MVWGEWLGNLFEDWTGGGNGIWVGDWRLDWGLGTGDLRMRTGYKEMGIGESIGLIISKYQFDRYLAMLLQYAGVNRVLAWHDACINVVSPWYHLIWQYSFNVRRDRSEEVEGNGMLLSQLCNICK